MELSKCAAWPRSSPKDGCTVTLYLGAQVKNDVIDPIPPATTRSPLVTAVVATYNEEAHVRLCLEGLLNQRDVGGDVEILVVDGGSSDATVDIVKSLPEYGSRIRLIPNPRRFQVYAWNIGIREARGRFVALFSAHTEYSPDYLARCLEVRERTGAAHVGGVQVPVGDGPIGNVIAWAMQSPFGIGDARFRYAREEQFADVAWGLFCEKTILEAIGGFDESIPFNEDSELFYRLRRAGYTIFMSPSIKVTYHTRSSLPRLAQQMFRYGFWRRKTQMIHPRYVPLRVYVPPMLVLGLVLSILGYAAARTPFAAIAPAAYVLFLATAAIVASLKRRNIWTFFITPIVLAVMHISYGVGWLIGFFVHAFRPHVRRSMLPAHSKTDANIS